MRHSILHRWTKHAVDIACTLILAGAFCALVWLFAWIAKHWVDPIL